MVLRRSIFLVCVVAVVTGLVVPVAQAAAVPLRMYAAAREVTLHAYGGGRVSLDLGIYIAAPERAFEVQVSRDSYGEPIRAVQILGDGTTRVIGRSLLRGWNGFRDFFRLQVRSDGEVVRERQYDWCPGGWDLQRLNDDGPEDPRYPQGCYGNPFSLGTVWGIDRGWASPALDGSGIRLDEGRYRIRVRIAPAFRNLFQIGLGDGTTTVRAKVVEGGSCCSDRVATRISARPDIPTVTDPDPASLPDLIALPAFGISVDAGRNRDVLSFAANVWNAGPAPLTVEGFRREGTSRMDAFQYFSRDGRTIGKAPVGGFEYDRHDGHHHWHFLQFAQYRLLDAHGDHVVRSHKQAFCLAPTDAIDLLVRGATWRPESIGFSRCGGPTSIWIREVLPAGWGDTYYQGLFGQGFDITDVPNGTYFIEVAANPRGLLYDRTTANDVRYRKVVLRGSPGDRRVSVPAWHGIDA